MATKYYIVCEESSGDAIVNKVCELPGSVVLLGGIPTFINGVSALYVTCSDDAGKICRIQADSAGVLNTTVVTPDA